MLTLYIHGLAVPAAGGPAAGAGDSPPWADIRRALREAAPRRPAPHSLPVLGGAAPAGQAGRGLCPPAALSDRAVRAQIRVVNAFRQGLDSRGSLADAALAEALRKQTALSKRFSHSSSIEYADAARDTLAPHDIDVERLSSHSHTETAV
ncbi:hypothetical protein HF086_008601 [Spodoptera exigua]|uniref:Uncharacterized protein n=1 Tax=Spodoptera exigua TaxID=7107 RepID=A0A922M4E9_SPOEX|nr:hypothetical protein HF086_008601 [Spodoptera exigua]